MKGLRRLLRYLLVWWVSIPITVVVVLCAFVFWLAGTQSGARVLIGVVAQQLDGRAENVNGSVLGGLQVGRLQLALPDTAIDVTDLRLEVNWRALSDRLVQVRELSAGSVSVALTSTPDEDASIPSDDEPFTLPELPVKIAVDHFALGALSVTQDGEPLPVALHDIVLSLNADDHGAQLQVDSLTVTHDQVIADLRGKLALQEMRAPWPVLATIDIDARSAGEHSPLCASRMLTDKPTQKVVEPTSQCAATVQIQADGSLEGMNVRLNGATADGALTLLAQAGLALDQSFPLRTASVDMRLADKSGVAVTFEREPVPQLTSVDRIVATVDAQRLNIGDLVGGVIPPALLSARLNVDAQVTNVFDLKEANLQATIAEGSRWNKQALAGKVAGRVVAPNLAAVDVTGATPEVTGAASDPLAGFQLHDLLVDLTLGTNKVKAQGQLVDGKGALTLDADTPQLAAFWPDLPGGASVKAKLDGSLEQHKAELSARYTPAGPQTKTLGSAPLRADLGFTGSWGDGPAGSTEDATAHKLVGWRGKIDRLTADSMGFTAALQPVTLSFLPQAQAPQWQWEVGATQLTLSLPDKQRAVIAHQGSRGGHGRWQTAGRADNLVITTDMVKQIMRAVDPAAAAAEQANLRKAEAQRRIALDASWDMKFAGALAGSARISRRDGDLRIPGDPPIPLGLTKMVLDVKATPTQGGTSRLDAGLEIKTQKMGGVSGTAVAWMVADANGGMALDAKRAMRATIQADIDDLTWVDLFVGDTMEIRGKVQANIEAQGTLNGKWSTSGTIRGRDLRVVRIDDGVRLLEGTLDAHLDGTRLVLDSLRFPATLRVLPDEWRTKEWVTENPGAKGGYAEATGHWDLMTSQGIINLKLYRFPALQRSDRYAMVSGTVTVDAQLPRLAITGDLTADAGWFSLEILQGVPSLDDDVHVIKPGDAAAAKSSPLQLTMNLKFDMGPRFYITGMGLDAGLLGALEIRLADGRLSGYGSLRTRAGGIEAYGQKLRLRRGTLTFQGQLDNPLLDIEALRTGLPVEAGVQVLGTARRPKIDLVSYPDVSDVEKLSWLLLGRGPDESGGDTALLISIGTALLGGGQPFYKQFGLDDVSIRSGAIGSSGSLLPDNTVASQINAASDSDLATQFLVASKTFANGITLSVEQAMAGSATVGRASYELSKRWSVDLKGGTVNGLSLIYRIIFAN